MNRILNIVHFPKNFFYFLLFVGTLLKVLHSGMFFYSEIGTKRSDLFEAPCRHKLRIIRLLVGVGFHPNALTTTDKRTVLLRNSLQLYDVYVLAALERSRDCFTSWMNLTVNLTDLSSLENYASVLCSETF